MRKRNLTFKFTLMFAAFTLVTLVVSSILSYMNQMQLYKEQREESVQFVASYIEGTLVADDDYFVWYQKYFLEKHRSLLVPYDFDDAMIQDARHDYEEVLSREFPGKVLGTDMDFEDLSENAKNAYEIYSHEFYLAIFEKAREMFDLAYVYYFVPQEDGSEDMIYILDSERTERISDGKKYIELGIKEYFKKKDFPRLWEAWETGKRPKGYDIFDSEKGKTYAYYTPLFINGQKLGIIGIEVEIGKVNHEILRATLRQMLMIGGVLVIFMLFLLFLIRQNYIRKLVKLRAAIESYSEHKNSNVADHLAEEVTNQDEISVIMGKFAAMIYELESYMQNLTKTQIDLKSTRQQAIELNELAIKDSLTGIRNKTGYDKEVQKLEWEMADGLKEFGVAMIDLNFLKRINDTYGHDKGNIAIVTLCRIVCKIFEHSPVFRIGGDEFVVILRDQDLKNIDNLIEEFNRQLKEIQENPDLEYWEKTSAAIGYAIFDPNLDSAYDNVFKRADAEMYKAKKR